MENKIVVITGGASGIGLGIIKELIGNNTVISLDRNPGKIAKLKSALPKVESIKTDIRSEEELAHAISEIQKKHGRIDLLINNAGVGKGFDFVNLPEKELMDNVEMEMAINYFAPIRLTKKALPLLQKSSEPIVVVVSSGLAYMPMAALGSYCATKTAVHFATMSMRHLLAGTKIRVVEVLPPVVDTDISKDVNMPKMSTEKFARIFLSKLEAGKTVMNIGQSGPLSKFSRFMPKMAFKVLNKAPN